MKTGIHSESLQPSLPGLSFPLHPFGVGDTYAKHLPP